MWLILHPEADCFNGWITKIFLKGISVEYIECYSEGAKKKKKDRTYALLGGDS